MMKYKIIPITIISILLIVYLAGCGGGGKSKSKTPGGESERLYNLTVKIEGTGKVEPLSGTFGAGTVVELRVVSGSFDGWNGPVVQDGDKSVVVMDSDKVITAKFKDSTSIDSETTPSPESTIEPEEPTEKPTATPTATPVVTPAPTPMPWEKAPWFSVLIYVNDLRNDIIKVSKWKYEVYFSYNNTNSVPVKGDKGMFYPGKPENEPIIFEPGKHIRAFKVTFNLNPGQSKKINSNSMRSQNGTGTVYQWNLNGNTVTVTFPE